MIDKEKKEIRISLKNCIIFVVLLVLIAAVIISLYAKSKEKQDFFLFILNPQ